MAVQSKLIGAAAVGACALKPAKTVVLAISNAGSCSGRASSLAVSKGVMFEMGEAAFASSKLAVFSLKILQNTAVIPPRCSQSAYSTSHGTIRKNRVLTELRLPKRLASLQKAQEGCRVVDQPAIAVMAEELEFAPTIVNLLEQETLKYVFVGGQLQTPSSLDMTQPSALSTAL